MRASRMMSLLLHLQVGGLLSGTDLACRLEVSERTVQRDVEALVASGIPIRSVRGPSGGYRLDGGYRTRLTGVGADEAAALAFLGLSGPALDLGLGSMLSTVRTKVWASLTSEARGRAERTAERFHLDPVRWYGTAEPTPFLKELSDAVWCDRRIRVGYARSGQLVERVLDPLGLVLAAGDWYLLAQRDGVSRTYRVSRVSAVEVLAEPVRRPADFSLAEAWAGSRRELETRHECIEVTVRVQASALPRLRRLVAVATQDRIDVTVTGGWVELVVGFETMSWAVTALLGLGPEVEVMAPAAVRTQIAAAARGIAAHYRGDAEGRLPSGGWA